MNYYEYMDRVRNLAFERAWKYQLQAFKTLCKGFFLNKDFDAISAFREFNNTLQQYVTEIMREEKMRRDKLGIKNNTIVDRARNSGAI